MCLLVYWPNWDGVIFFGIIKLRGAIEFGLSLVDVIPANKSEFVWFFEWPPKEFKQQQYLEEILSIIYWRKKLHSDIFKVYLLFHTKCPHLSCIDLDLPQVLLLRYWTILCPGILQRLLKSCRFLNGLTHRF